MGGATQAADVRAPVRGHEGLYEPLGWIAAGGMATITLAREARPSAPNVVLKRLHPRYARDSELIELFEREEQILRACHHPNVIRLIDGGAEDGVPFLVMEHVRGLELGQMVRLHGHAQRPVRAEMAAAIAAGLLSALEHVHALRFVHRDVSPLNVLVSRDGDVKLIDFGIAEPFSEARPDGAPRTLRGKMPYMAPETFRGEAIDGRTDLWSAGVVVWELLAGRPLFNCENRRQMLERILRDPIPTLAEHRPDLPSSIVFFVHALLHRERTLRPADALGRLRALAAREGWDLGRDRLANLVRQILSDTGWRVTIVPQPAS